LPEVDRRRITKPKPPASAAKTGWLAVVGLLALSVVLLTAAFAPLAQFYFAWIGLAPWLLAIYKIRRNIWAFLGGWLAGAFFFAANLWWMYAVSAPGLIALVLYCGFYFGLIALVIRRARLLEINPLFSVLAIAAIWTAGDFIRANLMTGFPWIFIGHTQTPILPMCQIADALGAFGVTFWVVMANVWFALAFIRRRIRPLLPAGGLVLGLLLVIFIYGEWRMNQATTYPGPTVLVVQSNYPQSNSGEKGVSDEELLSFHVESTKHALQDAGLNRVNLAVWSETMMPALNHQAVHELAEVLDASYGHIIEQALFAIRRLAVSEHVAILTGARYLDHVTIAERDGKLIWQAADERNSTYLFQADGSMGDGIGQRYDKLHLVPFGEYIPFKGTWLYSLFLKLGPNYYADYELQNGSDNGMTVFTLKDAGQDWRFVTPICFEDLDSRLCSAMIRPGPDGQKRAEFMVNVTNDGWFTAGENADHLQAAVFRDIENRVPTARSVNSGISGFIDSNGRESGLLDARTTGTSIGRMELDRRVSPYSRWGDWFAWLCVASTAVVCVVGRRMVRNDKQVNRYAE
jgi:apolipoprotein N-acyltransferase